MMKPQDVGASYDQLADHWDGDGFNRANGIAQHERALQFAPASGQALDIGCGSSGRLINLLIEHDFTVEGLDISERMIELARARHPETVFHHADVCDWVPEKGYDFITAWDSIWHLPRAAHAATMEKILSWLRPGGVCIFTMGGVDEEGEKEDSAMGPPMYYSTLGIPQTLALVDRAGCICRHLEYDQHPELHVFAIVQRPAENA